MANFGFGISESHLVNQARSCKKAHPRVLVARIMSFKLPETLASCKCRVIVSLCGLWLGITQRAGCRIIEIDLVDCHSKISYGPRMQTRDVSSFISNWVISSIMSSRPWKTAGFRGICWTTVSAERCVADRRVSARISFIFFTSSCTSSTLSATCWVRFCIFARRAWSS